jgi:hypothetical protein
VVVALVTGTLSRGQHRPAFGAGPIPVHGAQSILVTGGPLWPIVQIFAVAFAL